MSFNNTYNTFKKNGKRSFVNACDRGEKVKRDPLYLKIYNDLLAGIKNGTYTNLAGKFAKGHWVSVKQPKTQSNGQISIKAASGWKIISAYYMAEGRNRMLTSERGLNSVTLFAGRMPAGESFRTLTMKFRNSKNGAVIECICQID